MPLLPTVTYKYSDKTLSNHIGGGNELIFKYMEMWDVSASRPLRLFFALART